MPVDISIIHAGDVLLATLRGDLDRPEARRVLEAIATAASPLADAAILLDTRHVSSYPTVTDLWYLATELVHYRGAFSHKTAVLARVEQFDRAAFFALTAANRGFRVRAFTSHEEAMVWLLA